jgi:hypothetical protein
VRKDRNVMATLRKRELAAAAVTILFLLLSLHFVRKGEKSPWHSTAQKLWEQEQWQKIRALGENLSRVKKEDAECFYLAMLASKQVGDPAGEQIFAERLLKSRVLNWTIEKRVERVYQTDSLKKRITLYRFRIVLMFAVGLTLFFIRSLVRKETYVAVPITLACAGIAILLL